ncbi:MAG: EamA family transporter [Comamonadaceae bacterium]|nr:MAG: EamA family transporter [Comamonadaceae bacterium]
MPLSAFALVVLAGLIHASWNIAAKKAGGDARFAFQSSVFIALIWAPLGLWLGWSEVPNWGLREWAFIGVSGVLHVLYYVVLLRGYRRADLTVVYPLARGTGPLLSSMAAVLLLGERLSALGLLGILGVVVGVFLIAGGPALARRRHSAEQQARAFKGIQYGVLTGLFIACYTVVDGYAVKMLAMSPILLDYMGNFVRLVLLAPNTIRDRAEAARLWRLQWKYALLVAAISPVSYVLVLYAMQQAPLSHVAPAREVSMLFAALIGGHLLQEGDRLMRLLGAVLIACGVAALALG